MKKPTIFFSHSSRDSSTILPIKNRITAITANALDIFMSSDGQSIPFGHNWVHKIEEGLNNAQIMFVFITPKSIKSDWIYFEAGFAYSKQIEVIPVGIGVNVGQLKAPLNLLQGFDITSADSLNNFISIINKKFNLQFNEEFTELDYKEVLSSITQTSETLVIGDILTHATYETCSQYSGDQGNIVRYDIDKYFSDIKDYLDKKSIQYAYNESTTHYSNAINKNMLVDGIQISIKGIEKEPQNNFPNQDHKFMIKLSTQNFIKSFNLLKELILEIGIEKEWMYLDLYFNKMYDCLRDKAAISSVVSDNKCSFKYLKKSIGGYSYNEKLNFWIKAKDDGDSRNKETLYVIGVSFKIKDIIVEDILGLIDELKYCHIIIEQNNFNKNN